MKRRRNKRYKNPQLVAQHRFVASFGLNTGDPLLGAKFKAWRQNVQIFLFNMFLLNYKWLFFMNAFSSEKRFPTSMAFWHQADWHTNRPFATNDHMVQNPLCWRASSLLSPHWDVQTRRPQPVFVLMSQCGNNNELALQHGGFCTMWSFVPKGLFAAVSRGTTWSRASRKFQLLFP